MQIISRIIVDLQRKTRPLVYAMQNDAGTRAVKVALYDGGTVWAPPDGVTMSVAYRRAAGTVGKYDTLPDGSAACSVSGNEVVAVLSPPVLAEPGRVAVSIVFEHAGARLATFPFDVMSEGDLAAGAGAQGGDYDKGYTAGRQAEYDRFWNAVFDSANGNFGSAFASQVWNDETFNPDRSIVCTAGTATTAFNNAKITTTKVPIEIRVATADMMFAGCSNLKTVPYLGFFGVTSTGSFTAACNNLEEITVDGEIQSTIGFAACSKLTNASVQSIIDHLKDLTGTTSKQVAFHSTVKAKMTEEQVNAIWAKNWTM